MRPVLNHPKNMGALVNYTPGQLARLSGHSVRTARRWRAQQQAPAPVVDYLWLKLDGQLGSIDARWSGWILRHGALHHPEGWTFTPQELTALPLHLQELAALRRELSGLRQQVKTLLDQALALENQPPALCRAS